MNKQFTPQEAAAIAEQLGIDRSTVAFTLASFTQGMNVELEHGSRDPATDVTHDDPFTTGKIALAHLHEIPAYYELLDEMEKKAEGK